MRLIRRESCVQIGGWYVRQGRTDGMTGAATGCLTIVIIVIQRAFRRLVRLNIDRCIKTGNFSKRWAWICQACHREHEIKYDYDKRQDFHKYLLNSLLDDYANSESDVNYYSSGLSGWSQLWLSIGIENWPTPGSWFLSAFLVLVLQWPSPLQPQPAAMPNKNAPSQQTGLPKKRIKGGYH